MTRIAIAGPSSVVTDAAVGIGEEGGSVVDVAIVAALTAMCTEPGVCGPGGGGFLAIDVPGEEAVVIDGYMAYPGIGFDGAAYAREVSMPYGGGVTTVVGAGSIAVPGGFAGFDLAWRMFGRVPWSELMEAVAAAVEDGFPLSAPCHLYLNDGADSIFREDPVVEAALFEGTRPRSLGASIVFPGLADTLRYIGSHGADVFYRGDLAAAMVDDLSGRGGRLTTKDMESYRAIARQPFRSSIGQWSLALNPGPAVGGVMVGRTLELLDEHQSSSIARALIRAFRERRDPSLQSPSTISVAAADEEGGVVAGSFSAGYGSGVVPRGTGMLMNNALGELELVSELGAPGDRMLSNMAPTVGRSHDDSVALGSPGADRITTAVATTLWRLADGDSLQQAIDYPRVHPEFGDSGIRLAAEPGQDLEEDVMTVRWFDAPHMYFGGVNGTGFLRGHLQAHADARRTGSVAFTA